MAEERVPTHITGLDEFIEGGVIKGHVVLVMGEPGLRGEELDRGDAHRGRRIVERRAEGRNGLFVTLEQSRKSVITQMASLGMIYDEVEDQLSILDLAILRKKMKLGKKSWMEVFKMYANNLKKSLDYRLLVIDSLTVLELLAAFKEPRIELFELFEWLRDLEVTTFLPVEMTQKGDPLALYGEDYLADGIILLRMERVGDIHIQRRIRVVKLRATKHSTNYFTLLHQGNHFEVTKVITEK